MRPRSLSVRLALVAMLVTLVIGGCKSTVTGPESELQFGRARWAMVGPASYSVVVSRSCECLEAAVGPVRVTVRNGVVQSRDYTRTGAPVATTRDDWFPTVEELFAVIDAAIRDGIQPLDVSYDPTLGYPTRVFIGETASDGGAAYFARDVIAQ
jgi:Family of unknown function (DUF6174)